jgi:hypothetical protein
MSQVEACEDESLCDEVCDEFETTDVTAIHHAVTRCLPIVANGRLACRALPRRRDGLHLGRQVYRATDATNRAVPYGVESNPVRSADSLRPGNLVTRSMWRPMNSSQRFLEACGAPLAAHGAPGESTTNVHDLTRSHRIV